MKESTQIVPADKAGVFKAVFRFLNDPCASTLEKLALTIGSLYIVAPLDVVPEMVLGPIGLVDDAVVAAPVAYLLYCIVAYYQYKKSVSIPN